MGVKSSSMYPCARARHLLNHVRAEAKAGFIAGDFDFEVVLSKE